MISLHLVNIKIMIGGLRLSIAQDQAILRGLILIMVLIGGFTNCLQMK